MRGGCGDAPDLTDAFAAPGWLRDLGATAWLLVGVTLFLVGAVWLLSLTQTIVMPVLAAGVIAAVASPLVAWLARHRVPRGVAAALLLLGLVAVAVGVFIVSWAASRARAGDIGSQLSDAAEQDRRLACRTWASIRARPSNAKQDASSVDQQPFHALLDGVAAGHRGRSPRSSSSSRSPPSASSSCSRTARRSAPGRSATSAFRARRPHDHRTARCSRCAATSSA